MSRIDDMVHRIVRTAFAAGIVDDPPRGRVVDPFLGGENAQKIAEQGSVLLKNARALLPLDAGRVKSIAIIGSKADTSVLSGGGSAQVDPPGGGHSRFGHGTFALPIGAGKPALTACSSLSDLYNGNRVGIQFDSKILRVIQ
jgi:beta-glucosidase-like glycosyl hydrolase